MLGASSCSTLGVSDMPYILPQHPLRVSQKAKSHLEIINEPLLVTAPSRDECGHWAGWVKGPAVPAPQSASSLWRMIMETLRCVTVHVRHDRKSKRSIGGLDSLSGHESDPALLFI